MKKAVPLFCAIVLSLAACATGSKSHRVGILCGVDFFLDTADGFKSKMAELGYVEGRNVSYDLKRSGFDPGLERNILEKFVSDKVDLILTFPTEVSLEAKQITHGTKVPMIFANANIEGVDLVKSVREPGDNITGVRYPGPDLAIKRFEVLLDLMPKVKRVWLYYLRGYPIVASQLEVLYPAARSAGVSLVEVPADNAAELHSIFARGGPKDGRTEAILAVAEPLFVTPDAFAEIARYASRYRILTAGAMMHSEGYGTIFGISTDNRSVGAQAAVLADKIFKGVPAGTMPVLSAESYFSIDYSIARRLGVKIPDELLAMADEVIR